MYALVNRYREGSDLKVRMVYVFDSKEEAERYNAEANFPNPEFNLIVKAYAKEDRRKRDNRVPPDPGARLATVC